MPCNSTRNNTRYNSQILDDELNPLKSNKTKSGDAAPRPIQVSKADILRGLHAIIVLLVLAIPALAAAEPTAAKTVGDGMPPSGHGVTASPNVHKLDHVTVQVYKHDKNARVLAGWQDGVCNPSISMVNQALVVDAS